MATFTEFGRPSVALGRKGLRTIVRQGWVPSLEIQSGLITPGAFISPGQRDTADPQSVVAPSASDIDPSNPYKYFGAFLTGQRVEATSRNGARALVRRTFEELNDGTIDTTALIYQGTLTKSANPTLPGFIAGPNGSNVQTWPPPSAPTPAAPWTVPATIPAGLTPPSGYSSTRAALAVPAFAGRTFQQIIPFRFPGVYQSFPPVSKHVTATIVELFFLADPLNATLGYEPLKWCQNIINYTPNGGIPASPVYQYLPGYLEGNSISAAGYTYNGIDCSTFSLQSSSVPAAFPAAGYQMIQTAKDFYGEGGTIYMRRDVYINFPSV